MIKTVSQNISTLLEALTRELTSLNLWQVKAPSIVALNSSAPFCCDTLAFEQWLQFIFIPKLSLMITEQQRLPSTIALTPMAEEAFQSLASNTEALMEIILKIDNTLTMQGK